MIKSFRDWAAGHCDAVQCFVRECFADGRPLLLQSDLRAIFGSVVERLDDGLSGSIFEDIVRLLQEGVLRSPWTCLALREPSLGPVFGQKGGATGGGRASLVPSQDINLHFTGDFHAISAANNLLAALLDNHLHQGNRLGLDPRRILWRRVLDLNDRALRHVKDATKRKALPAKADTDMLTLGKPYIEKIHHGEGAPTLRQIWGS